MKNKPKTIKWQCSFEKTEFSLIPVIRKNPLLWKDKFNTPRCELPPRIDIEWLGIHFGLWQGDDEEWEQWLWIYEYNNGDYEKAKNNWPWKYINDDESEISTWIL